MKHLIKSLDPFEVYCKSEASYEQDNATAAYTHSDCPECKQKAHEHWDSLPETNLTKWKYKPITHKGMATFEIEQIPPEHDYQEKIYPDPFPFRGGSHAIKPKDE